MLTFSHWVVFVHQANQLQTGFTAQVCRNLFCEKVVVLLGKALRGMGNMGGWEEVVGVFSSSSPILSSSSCTPVSLNKSSTCSRIGLPATEVLFGSGTEKFVRLRL